MNHTLVITLNLSKHEVSKAVLILSDCTAWPQK